MTCTRFLDPPRFIKSKNGFNEYKILGDFSICCFPNLIAYLIHWLICPPDVTPTGSLRRRRSRVPSEDDESTLMDFLRASGHDGTRERKSWGSLGEFTIYYYFKTVMVQLYI